MVDLVGHVSIFGGREVHWVQRPSTRGQVSVRSEPKSPHERIDSRPPVLFLAGCGLAMDFWRTTAQLLPDFDRVALDRPGMGGTRWPGHLPLLSEEVATLVDLIEHVGVPMVVVAHSMASFHAEALARERPDLVAGLVMVDGSVEYLSSPPPTLSPKLARGVRAAAGFGVGNIAGWFYRLGTWAQSNWQLASFGLGRLPALYANRDVLAMATAEAMAYQRQAWDLLDVRANHPWPKTPTIVLTAQHGEGRKWREVQERWAGQLDARHAVVHGSHHLMMLDSPEVIASAVWAVTKHLGGLGPLEAPEVDEP